MQSWGPAPLYGPAFPFPIQFPDESQDNLVLVEYCANMVHPAKKTLSGHSFSAAGKNKQ
jgi:hypothetical protein